MCISFERSANRRLVVEVSSAFLLDDAQQLGAAIARSAPGSEIAVEFRKVRECQGPALARLAEVLRTDRVRVALRGVSEHDRKLLGYLGAPADALTSRATQSP